GGAGGSVDLTLTLRAGKTALRNAAFQQEVVEQVLEVLAQHLAQWSCSVALPELSHLSSLQLRRFAKTTKVDKFRQAARGLLAVLDRNVAWVGAARDQVDFAPRDLSKFGGKAGKKRGRADSDDEEDADEDNGGNRKHPGKRPGAARQAGNDEDSSGDEEAAPAPRGNIVRQALLAPALQA
ncbi:nucleolar complex 2-like protein, partial [Haematococcus lacustris]